jgi:ABC-2 type transport system permease protein
MSETMDYKPQPIDLSQAPKPLPSLGAVSWIAWFSLREMSRRRRLLSLGAINLLPVLVVLAIRIWFADQGISAQLQLSSLTQQIIIPFLIPIVAMAVGVSAIGEQVEEGTIVYLWTRPVRRRAIYLGRLLAAQAVSSLLLSGSLILCFLVMISEGLQVIDWAFLKLYLVTFLIIVLGTFSYSAVFAAMGTFFRKPVLPAILFAFGWEAMVSNIPARVQELSLRFHLQNIVEIPKVVPDNIEGVLGALLTTAFQREPVPKVQSVLIILAVMLFFTGLGIWLLRMKEIEK